jgi:hypothetical protein
VSHRDGRYVILDYAVPASALTVAHMQRDLAVLNTKHGEETRT